MIEIYLFIHPLCPDSLASEKRILQMIQADPKKIQFKFLPLLNFQYFQEFLTTHNYPTMNLDERNTFYNHSYNASLDYKAMLLQGKKKGRAFLFTLQEAIASGQYSYSPTLTESIVKKIDGDLAMFYADRTSELVKESFIADQETAKEMSVTQIGSIVIFNYAAGDDFGILLEEEPPQELLSELCSIKRENASLINLGADQRSVRSAFMTEPTYLKLLEN